MRFGMDIIRNGYLLRDRGHMIFGSVINTLKISKLARKWRKLNLHNNTTIAKEFDMSRVTVGNFTYGLINPYFYDNPKGKITIGSFCSIAEGTKFVFGEHDYNRPMTFPIDAYICDRKEINPIKGDIVIEDDVWIGMDSIILSGVTIHQGAVIGAGSVVAKDVPPYAIFAGGKVVKYRFEEMSINKLLEIDYSKLTREDVIKNRDLLYERLSDNFFDSSICR